MSCQGKLCNSRNNNTVVSKKFVKRLTGLPSQKELLVELNKQTKMTYQSIKISTRPVGTRTILAVQVT